MNKNKTEKKLNPRIRARLLILIWVWAILMFVVIDLFLNVPEFDTVRSRSKLYRGMRLAAHKAVGTELEELDEPLRFPAKKEEPNRQAKSPETRKISVGDASIRGEVVFQSGEPVPYFEYRIEKGMAARGRRQSTWTGLTGSNFALDQTEAGVYSMWFRAPNTRTVCVAGVRANQENGRPLRIVLEKTVD